MGIVYIVVAVLVISLLLAIPAFPFWKVWRRVKTHHPDLWAAKGPFDAVNMMARPELFRGLLDIIALADKDEVIRARDPELVKWSRLAREVWRMMPSSFLGQITYFFILLYFVFFFTTLIMGVFRH